MHVNAGLAKLDSVASWDGIFPLKFQTLRAFIERLKQSLLPSQLLKQNTHVLWLMKLGQAGEKNPQETQLHYADLVTYQ